MSSKNTVLVNQDIGDILVFSFLVSKEKNTNSSVLTFNIEVDSEYYINYTDLIENDFYGKISTVSSNTYVPQPYGSEYYHESINVVDLIIEGSNGIKEISARFDPERYGFENVDDSKDDIFIIPKFEWDNTTRVISNENESENESEENIYWIKSEKNILTEEDNTYSFGFFVGNSEGYISHVVYNTGEITVDQTINLNSPVHKIYFSNSNSSMFISTDKYYYNYASSYYMDKRILNQSYFLFNNSRGKISLSDSNVWSTESYTGNISCMYDNNTLNIITQYENLDAPNKILRSKAHNTYFCSGTNILWKLENNNFISVYQINDFKINDFDISDTGEVCLLLENDEYSILRILHKNLYKILLDKKTSEEKFKYCKYCKNGIFYVLSEISTSDFIYKCNNYIYNVYSKKLFTYLFEGNIEEIEIVNTNIPITTDQVILLTNPNGFEKIKKGFQYEIKWISSKSLSDFVKIDLYKNDIFQSVITESTQNSGIYKWNISSDLLSGSDYKIKITWLSTSLNESNSDFSDNPFSIVLKSDNEIENETYIETNILNESIGVDYNKYNNFILIVLKSGLFGIFSLENNVFYGLYNTKVNNVLSFAVENNEIVLFSEQEKVRVFVGSAPNLSDKWDSGIINTNLTSMYYGGKRNLEYGKEYYVNIQTYSNLTGWSDIQTKTFIMPR